MGKPMVFCPNGLINWFDHEKDQEKISDNFSPEVQ